MFEIGIYDVSNGVQIVDIEAHYVIGVTPDCESAFEKIDRYCDINGIEYDEVRIVGDYM